MKLHFVLASISLAGIGALCISEKSSHGAMREAEPTTRAARAPFEINLFRPAFDDVRHRHQIIEASVWDYERGPLPVDRVVFKDEDQVQAFLAEDTKVEDAAPRRTLLIIAVGVSANYTGSTLICEKEESSSDGRTMYVPVQLKSYCAKVKVAYVVRGTIQYETPAVSVTE